MLGVPSCPRSEPRGFSPWDPIPVLAHAGHWACLSPGRERCSKVERRSPGAVKRWVRRKWWRGSSRARRRWRPRPIAWTPHRPRCDAGGRSEELGRPVAPAHVRRGPLEQLAVQAHAEGIDLGDERADHLERDVRHGAFRRRAPGHRRAHGRQSGLERFGVPLHLGLRLRADACQPAPHLERLLRSARRTRTRRPIPPCR